MSKVKAGKQELDKLALDIVYLEGKIDGFREADTENSLHENAPDFDFEMEYLIGKKEELEIKRNALLEALPSVGGSNE